MWHGLSGCTSDVAAYSAKGLFEEPVTSLDAIRGFLFAKAGFQPLVDPCLKIRVHVIRPRQSEGPSNHPKPGSTNYAVLAAQTGR